MLKRALLLVLFGIVTVAAAAFFMGPSFLKRKARTELYARMQIELEYKSISIVSLSPLKISITDLSLKKRKELSVTIKSLVTEINLKEILMDMDHKSIRYELLVDDIAVNYKASTDETAETAVAGTPSPIPTTGDLRDFLKNSFGIQELTLHTKIGKFDYNVQLPMGAFRVYGNNTTLKIANLDSPIDFTFNANVFSQSALGPLSQMYIPINIHSQVIFKNGVANILKSDFNIADIKNSFTGLVNLKNYDYDSSLKLTIEKIENVEFLKKNQAKFPVSDTKGSLNLDLSIRGNINDIPNTNVKGQLNLKNVSTHVNWSGFDVIAKGPLTLDLTSGFTYANKIPALNSASWKVNLDKMEIAYKDIFLKQPEVHLASEGTVSYLNDLAIERFRFFFHTLDVSAKGMASLLRSSDLQFSVKPFKLQDFKPFLPNNKNFEISGDVEIDGQIKGFLDQPKYLTMDLRKVQANNIKYFLKYSNELISVEGPLSFTFLGNLFIERAQVLKGSITGQSDLSSLVIKQKNQVMKAASELFKLAWSVRAHEGKLNIEKLNLNSFLANFTLKGQPPLAKDDSFDLSLDLESMQWKRVKSYLPKIDMLDTVADMNNKGSVRVRGKLDPFNLVKSKVSVDTNMETTITSVALPFNFHLSTAPAAKPDAVPVPLTTPTAFVKDPELLSAVRWNHKISIQNVSLKDSSKFQNISMTANLNKNQLKLDGEIGSIFNGKMAFKDVLIPLTENDPKIIYNLSSANLSFASLIEFVMPEYKDLLKGVANLEVSGSSKLPGTLNFKPDLVARGKFNIPVSEVQTLKVLNEVKQKFASIKDYGVPASVNISNLSASTEARFEIQKQIITLEDMKLVARNQDEVQLKGVVSFDLDSKLSGVLRLVNLPVSGDFLLANQNKAGQVEIPVVIEGNLKEPKWSFVGNTFEKMTQNFFDFQKNKAKALVDRKVAEVKTQANAELNKQKKQAEALIEQKKKELENEAVKKLDALFK